MSDRARRRVIGEPLFVEKKKKQVDFARKVGPILDDIVREADDLGLSLLAQFAAMARVEADAIAGPARQVHED